MKPILLLCFVVSLSANAQAVRPATVPVPHPPAYTPGYAPGTPPEPTYTPTGAGLPGEREPGAVAPAVPRSKGRILPREPDGAPGLWAADGAPQTTVASHLFDVEIPSPPDQDPSARINLTSACISGLTNAMREVAPHILAYAEPIRACMAARAYEQCADFLEKAARQASSHPMHQGWRPPAPSATMKKHAAALAARWCAGVEVSTKQDDSLEQVLTRWRWNRTNPD